MAPKRYKDDDSPFTPSGDLEDESTLDEILMDGDDDDSDEDVPEEDLEEEKAVGTAGIALADKEEDEEEDL
jgi:hypothetical protein